MAHQSGYWLAKLEAKEEIPLRQLSALIRSALRYMAMVVAPIILGRDPTLLDSHGLNTSIDPSGFLQCGFEAIATKRVCNLANDAWSTIIRSLPKKINIPMPATVPLYMEKAQPQQQYPVGAMRYRYDRTLASLQKEAVGTECKITILNYPIPEIRGIVLRFTPEMLETFSEDIYEILIHEMFHVLSHHALAASHVIAEAIVERLTQCILPPRRSREFMHLHWSPKTFSSTCGLRVDDFAETHRTEPFRDLIQIHALNSLTDLSYSDVWTIILSLLRQTKESGFSPSSLNILAEIKHSVGNDCMESVLRSALIRPLREGKQCFFCPFGAELFAFCFNVQKNEHYLRAPLEKPLEWDKYQFQVSEAATQLTVTVEDKNGKHYVADTILQGKQQFSYKTLLSVFSGTEHYLLEHDIRNISCKALGAEAIF